LYSSQNKTGKIKIKDEDGNGQDENAYNLLVTKPEGRNNLENLGVDRWIILKLVLKIQGVRVVHWINLAQDKDQ
jgi:hypothetical protein